MDHVRWMLQLCTAARHTLLVSLLLFGFFASALTFLTGLCVGTALNAGDSSPMFTSAFLLTVMAEYFSATFSLSFASLLACFTSSFASPTGSDMLTLTLSNYDARTQRQQRPCGEASLSGSSSARNTPNVNINPALLAKSYSARD